MKSFLADVISGMPSDTVVDVTYHSYYGNEGKLSKLSLSRRNCSMVVWPSTTGFEIDLMLTGKFATPSSRYPADDTEEVLDLINDFYHLTTL